MNCCCTTRRARHCDRSGVRLATIAPQNSARGVRGGTNGPNAAEISSPWWSLCHSSKITCVQNSVVSADLQLPLQRLLASEQCPE
jgi:hypothetical protein